MSVLDWRSQQKASGPVGEKPAGKLDRYGHLVVRERTAIDSICLHQMAVALGASTAAINAAKGDKDLARHRRALNVHAHVSAFIDGTVVLAYPLRAYVYHGNGANSRSIGLECEGFYNGLPSGTGAEPAESLIAAAREACSAIVAEAAKEGITIKHYVAHRQYAASRRADPGWAIWQKVGIDHCEKVIGLTPLLTLTDRDGKPIPSSWDRRSAGGY
jgi:hypothetical protein